MPKGYRLSSDNLPTFGLRFRRAFLNADNVTDCECPGLVMGTVFLGLAHGLLHDRVLETALDGNGYGLCVGCRCDGAGKNTFGHLSGSLLRVVGGRGRLLVQHGVDACHVAAHLTDARGVLELAGGLLKAEVEGLFLQRDKLIPELIRCLVMQFLGVHVASPFGQHHRQAPSLMRVTRFPVEVDEVARIGGMRAGRKSELHRWRTAMAARGVGAIVWPLPDVSPPQDALS